MRCSKMSAVECAGSVETNSTRTPRSLAASANAAEQVVFPTPPLPPKKTTRRSSSVSKLKTESTARQCAERRVVDAHPLVPRVELLEQERIHLEEIERGRIRQPGRLHEAQQREEIVEIGGLASQLALVRPERDAAHHLGNVLPQCQQVV